MIIKSYVKINELIIDLKNDERGVTAIEYGLIGVAMAVAIAAIFGSDGSMLAALKAAFAKITTEIGLSTGKTT